MLSRRRRVTVPGARDPELCLCLSPDATMRGTHIAAAPLTAKKARASADVTACRLTLGRREMARSGVSSDCFCTVAQQELIWWSLQAPRESVASGPVEAGKCTWFREPAEGFGGCPWISHQ